MPLPIPGPDDTGENSSTRMLPDPKVCHTKPIGDILSFGNCLVDSPYTCPYVIYFGEGQFCSHPNWKGFREHL